MNKRILTSILAGVMTLALAVSASADETNTVTIGGTLNIIYTNNYILTIPASNTDLDLLKTDAQSIGTLKVNPKNGELFNTGNHVTVIVTSANSGTLKNATSNETIPYTLVIGSTPISSWNSSPAVIFSSDDINSADSGKGFSMTVKINDASAYVGKSNGDYRDVLTFTAKTDNTVIIAASSDGGVPATTLDVKGCTYWSDVLNRNSGSITTHDSGGKNCIQILNADYIIVHKVNNEYVAIDENDVIDSSDTTFIWQAY